MGLENWFAAVVKNRRTLGLVALIATFAGVALIVDRPEGSVSGWAAFPLLVGGGGIFVWAVWPSSTASDIASQSLASRFLTRLTLGGRLVGLFPAFGVAIILADLTYNTLLSATPALQTEDTIVLLGAMALLGYRLVPNRFARERDFVLLFFFWLNAILVVPLLVARLYFVDFERSVDLYSWIALAPEASAVLNILGVSNQLHPVTGSTAPGLTFTPQQMVSQVTLVITTACSGIYSFGIFSAAFVAFVMIEFQRFSRRTWLLLALGLSSSYAANVLRMVVIVLVGYYTDTVQTDLQNMLVAHSYAGWLIFLGWISLFWTIAFRWLAERPISDKASGPPTKRGANCGICSKALSPVLPGQRCECGKFYHVACASAVDVCPACHHLMGAPGKVVGARLDGSS